MGFWSWTKSKLRKEETTTVRDTPASSVVGKDSYGKPAPIVGDTPSGYVDKAPQPTSGTTTVTYGKRQGGGSSRKVVTPTGETYEQTPEQAQRGENLPQSQKLEPSSSKLSQDMPIDNTVSDA